MTFRSAIPDFQLANPLYIGALVRFYTVDINGLKTATLAPLYANPLGPATLSNPQTLDAEGKFAAPVYYDVPLIAEVSGLSVASVDTGIIMPAASWGGNWSPGALLIVNTFVRDPVGLSIYIATNTFNTSGSIATDLAAGNLALVFQGQAAEAAAASASAAAASALQAAASLGQIQTQRRVAIDYQSAPPASPTSGNSYLVKTPGSGAWLTHSEKIATWNGSAWTFEVAAAGWQAWLTATSQQWDFNGTTWQSGVVRADVSQTSLFNASQKTQARRNVGITEAADLVALASDLSSMQDALYINYFGSIRVRNLAYGPTAFGVPLTDVLPTTANTTIVADIPAFTPKYASSKIKISVSIPVYSAVAQTVFAAVFRDALTNTFAIGRKTVSAFFYDTVEFFTIIDAVDTATRGYSLRCGGSSAAVFINGDSSSRKFGGSSSVDFCIEELRTL